MQIELCEIRWKKVKSGRTLMVVDFVSRRDDKRVFSWVPKWTEVFNIWMDAFAVELTNMIQYSKGNPEEYLIKPIVEFLNKNTTWELIIKESPQNEMISKGARIS